MKNKQVENVAAMLAAAIIVAMAAGCTSIPSGGGLTEQPRKTIIGAEGIPRPDWMSRAPNAEAEPLYYVIGDGRAAQTETAKRQLARTDGLSKLAQWKNVVVADTMKNYISEGGTIGNTQTLTHFEQATVARASANLTGFDQVDYWVDPDGVYHILYSYPKNEVKKDFTETVQEFKRNEAAAFAEFKADQAFKLLEAQLDNQQ
jgi:hypothetical protein